MITACVPAFAGEEKTKGLDVVTDTALAVIRKTNAFFQGNLDWTMQPEKDIYKKDYAPDALGRKVSRSTLGRFDTGTER